MQRSFFKKKKKMRIIGIFTVLAIDIASPSKDAATLERDTTAMATLGCKLLATAAKVEAVLDAEIEAKIANRSQNAHVFCFSCLTTEHIAPVFGC